MRHDDRWDDDLLAAIHAPSAVLAEALIASALLEAHTNRRPPDEAPPGDDAVPQGQQITVPLRPRGPNTHQP